jgi:hypothetical protein
MKSTNLKSYVAPLLALSLSTSYAVAKSGYCTYEGPYNGDGNKIGAQVSGELSWSITDGVIKFHDNKSAYPSYDPNQPDSRKPINLGYIDYMRPYFLADMIEIKQNGPKQSGFKIPAKGVTNEYMIVYNGFETTYDSSYKTKTDSSGNFTYLSFDLKYNTPSRSGYYFDHTYNIDIKNHKANLFEQWGDKNHSWNSDEIFHLTECAPDIKT